MGDTLQMTFSKNASFLKEKFWISNKILQNYVPWWLIGNKSALAVVEFYILPIDVDRDILSQLHAENDIELCVHSVTNH